MVSEPVAAAAPEASGGPSLRQATAEHKECFATALAARDIDACVTTLINLDGDIAVWSADTDMNDHADRARAVLHEMVIRLGDTAKVGARDPRTVLAPYVELLLEVRATARAAKDFAMADVIRTGLAGAGVEVRDTADGVDWVLTEAAGD